jgi:hypothetical protein
MLCLGTYILFKAETKKDVVNMVCYFALAGVGIASGVMVSRLTSWPSIGHYEKDGVTVPAEGGGCSGGRAPKGAIWVHEYTKEVKWGGFLESQHHNTLPIGTHAVIAAERINGESLEIDVAKVD